jgi:CHAT domain-containing protein/Flp pilus assembly protein TadD
MITTLAIAPQDLIAQPTSGQQPQPAQSNSITCGSTPATRRADALYYIAQGSICRNQGKLAEAIAAYQAAIQLNPTAQIKAVAYNNLGLVYAQQGLLSQAIASYRSAVEQNPDLVLAYSNWADALRQQGNLAEAEQKRQEADATSQRLATRPGSGGEDLIRQGNELSNNGRLEEAIEAYRLAIQINPNLIAAYNNLGNALVSRGRQQQQQLKMAGRAADADAVYQAALTDAVTAYQQATQVPLPPNPPVNYRNALTLAYDGLGFALNELGRGEESAAAYDQALKTDPRLSMFPDLTQFISAPAATSISNGCNVPPEPNLSQSDAASQPTAANLNYLGRTLRNQRRSDRAIVAYQRAIARDPKFAAAYNNLGVVLAERELLDQAIACYRQATQLDPTPIQFANLGNALRSAGRIDEALQAYQGTDNVLDRIEKLPGRVENLDLLDTLLTGQRNFDWYQSRAQFFAQKQDYYTGYIRQLMELNKLYPNKGLDRKALEVSERARARGLLETLAEANICQAIDRQITTNQTTSGNQLADLIKEECRLRREFKQQIDTWNRLNNTTGQLTSATPEATETEKKAIEQQIQNLSQQYETIQAQIRAINSEYAQLVQPSRLTVQDIQTQILDNNTILIEYWLDTDRSYMWVVSKPGVISPTGFASYVLSDRATISQAAREFYNYLTIPSERVKPVRTAQAGMRLSKMILGNVASQLKNYRLLVVADGMLRYIPFSALPDPNADDRFVNLTDITDFNLDRLPDPLLASHEIVNSPSASILATIRQRAANRRPPAQTLAILADPVFNREDERFHSSTANPTPPLPSEPPPPNTTSNTNPTSSAQSTSIESPADDPDNAESEESSTTVQETKPLTVGVSRFPRLPGTQREAERILRIAQRKGFGNSSRSFLGFEVNQQTLADLNQYRILHFATHGVLDDRQPGQSRLILSQFDEQKAPVQNGFLDMSGIFSLDLSADLVVLSSCRTGLGTEVTGEGLVGLAQGFLRAGAESVVVSLWSVNDEATSRLMESFYQKVLGNLDDHNTTSPAQALRAAQRELWNSRRWKIPYYWAAFTVQGDWQ